MKKNLELSSEIVLSNNSVIPFFSDGKWSLFHLLSHVLKFTGPANVRISSFSISEDAIRSFIEDKVNGNIKDVSLLFDTTIPGRKFDLMLFADCVFTQIKLTQNHSKVILIEGEKFNACILSSQNLTPNPRIEAGVIFTTPEHYAFYSEHFDHYFDNAIPFDPYDD